MDACGGLHPRFDVSRNNWADETQFGIINTTVGWLLMIDEDWCVTAEEIDEENRPRGITEVPTAIVLEVKTLVEATK